MLNVSRLLIDVNGVLCLLYCALYLRAGFAGYRDDWFSIVSHAAFPIVVLAAPALGMSDTLFGALLILVTTLVCVDTYVVVSTLRITNGGRTHSDATKISMLSMATGLLSLAATASDLHFGDGVVPWGLSAYSTLIFGNMLLSGGTVLFVVLGVGWINIWQLWKQGGDVKRYLVPTAVSFLFRFIAYVLLVVPATSNASFVGYLPLISLAMATITNLLVIIYQHRQALPSAVWAQFIYRSTWIYLAIDVLTIGGLWTMQFV